MFFISMRAAFILPMLREAPTTVALQHTGLSLTPGDPPKCYPPLRYALSEYHLLQR